jgi:glycosyltransferase involved in cell wall biosynthesis
LRWGQRADETKLTDFCAHLTQARDVAKYYQAADLYVHAAVADTFLASLEALACGTPVVATGVGGIPEQIPNLDEAQHSRERK